MGFYRIHLLDVVNVEFMIVPIIMVVGGCIAFLVSVFGFYATAKQDSCLLVAYAIFMTLQFCITIAGVICAVRLIFYIRTGLFNVSIVPELQLYESSSWVKYKWDTLQRKHFFQNLKEVPNYCANFFFPGEFACCGGYSWNTGFTDWKHTFLGLQNSVPDSCCLKESYKCGAKVFEVIETRKIVDQIHTHGCITIMLKRLETHVMVIFAIH